jgi:hypothetical protein
VKAYKREARKRFVLERTTELIRSAPPAPLTNDLCRRHPVRHCTRTRHPLAPTDCSITGCTSYPVPLRAVAFFDISAIVVSPDLTPTSTTHFSFSSDVSRLCGSVFLARTVLSFCCGCGRAAHVLPNLQSHERRRRIAEGVRSSRNREIAFRNEPLILRACSART